MIKNRTLSPSGYGTHIIPLLASVLHTEGDIVELGMGDYSTPLLHEIINYQRESGIYRELFSYEHDIAWLNNFIDLKTDWHKITRVKNWETVNHSKIAVLFVDHAPAERRIVDIEKFKDVADIIVVHDSEKVNYYGYNKVFPLFKYQYTYERYSKQTTLLSNNTDVTKIFKS